MSYNKSIKFKTIIQNIDELKNTYRQREKIDEAFLIGITQTGKCDFLDYIKNKFKCNNLSNLRFNEENADEKENKKNME